MKMEKKAKLTSISKKLLFVLSIIYTIIFVLVLIISAFADLHDIPLHLMVLGLAHCWFAFFYLHYLDKFMSNTSKKKRVPPVFSCISGILVYLYLTALFPSDTHYRYIRYGILILALIYMLYYIVKLYKDYISLVELKPILDAKKDILSKRTDDVNIFFKEVLGECHSGNFDSDFNNYVIKSLGNVANDLIPKNQLH
jgi:hypothetical protein